MINHIVRTILRIHCAPPTVAYLPYRVSGQTLTAAGRSQLLARWSGTHFQILSGIQRAAHTVLGVYLKRNCSHVTGASSALGVLNDYALYKSTHSLTRLHHTTEKRYHGLRSFHVDALTLWNSVANQNTLNSKHYLTPTTISLTLACMHNCESHNPNRG